MKVDQIDFEDTGDTNATRGPSLIATSAGGQPALQVTCNGGADSNAVFVSQYAVLFNPADPTGSKAFIGWDGTNLFAQRIAGVTGTNGSVVNIAAL